MKIKIFVSFIALFIIMLYYSILANPAFKNYKVYQEKYNAYIQTNHEDLDFSQTNLKGYINGMHYELEEIKMSFDQYKGYTCLIYQVDYKINNFEQLSKSNQIRAYGYELEIPIKKPYYSNSFKVPTYKSNHLLYIDQSPIDKGDNQIYFFWCKASFSSEERLELENGNYVFRIGDGSDKKNFCTSNIADSYGHLCPAMYKKENIKVIQDEFLKIENIPYIKEWLYDHLL